MYTHWDWKENEPVSEMKRAKRNNTQNNCDRCNQSSRRYHRFQCIVCMQFLIHCVWGWIIECPTVIDKLQMTTEWYATIKQNKKKRSNWNDEWNENTNVPSAISIGFSAAPLNRLTGTRITLIYRLVSVSFIFAWCFVVIGNWTHHYSMWVRWSVLNWSVWMLCAWSRLLLFQCVNLSSDTNRSPSSSQLHFITGY